jgi:hypothetical protein
MTRQLLDRREFGGLCAALGSSLPAVSAMLAGLAGTSAFAATAGGDSNPADGSREDSSQSSTGGPDHLRTSASHDLR